MATLPLGTYTQATQNIPASPGVALGRFFGVGSLAPLQPAQKGPPGAQKDPPGAPASAYLYLPACVHLFNYVGPVTAYPAFFFAPAGTRGHLRRR